jgi:DNA-binding PadR family transcriptional regulator
MGTAEKIMCALDDGSELSTAQIRKKAGLWWFEPFHWSLYVIEKHGLVTSRWADEQPPRRRLYRLKEQYRRDAQNKTG